MGTKNVVPRADGEGRIGTSTKRWGEGHFTRLDVNAWKGMVWADPTQTQQSAGNGYSIRDLVTDAAFTTATKMMIVLGHESSSSATNYSFTGSYDLSSYPDIFFWIQPGARFNVSAGYTLTLYSAENLLCSPRQTIFTGSGEIVFSQAGHDYASWWGSTGDSDTVAEGKASSAYSSAYSVHSPSGKVKFGSGLNYITMTPSDPSITMTDTSATRFKVGKLGTGDYGMESYTAAGTSVFKVGTSDAYISGWKIKAASLGDSATDDDCKIFLDSTNTLIRVGAKTAASNYITVDGANLRIRTGNYTSGQTGTGFTLEPDLLEVGNISCRGLIRSSVFEKGMIQATGGSIFVTKSADVLDADMTAADNADLTTKGTVDFATNDVLRIKDGADDEWFIVTNAGAKPTYQVTRDASSGYGTGANPTWKKGATVVNYGPSGGGGVQLSAVDTNAPWLKIFSHTGSPWSSTTEKVRLGNLNGYAGYSSNIYGLASYLDAATFFKIDPTGGIQLGGTNISINDSTFGNKGVQIQYNSGSPQLYIGNGSSSYIKYQSSAFTFGNDVKINAPNLWAATAGDYLISVSANLWFIFYSASVTSSDYTKIAGSVVGRPGTFRVKFMLVSNVGGETIRGTLYKNSSPVGLECSNGTTDYVTYSQDLSFTTGDIVELYARRAGTANGIAGNLTFYVGNPLDVTTSYPVS